MVSTNAAAAANIDFSVPPFIELLGGTSVTQTYEKIMIGISCITTSAIFINTALPESKNVAKGLVFSPDRSVASPTRNARNIMGIVSFLTNGSRKLVGTILIKKPLTEVSI